jgi:hypothetical protein
VVYSLESNDVNINAEESLLLEAFARERLMYTQQARKMLSGCCGDL